MAARLPLSTSEWTVRMDRRLQSALPSALYSVPMWQLLRHNVAVRPRPTSASMGVVWGLAGEIRHAERGKARRAGKNQ